MLSVSVSEQVKFKSKKNGTVSVLPVTVEFGKFVGTDSNSKTKQKRNTSSGTNRPHRQNTDTLSAPSELLHAVVALYHTYLPGYSLDTIYKTLCKEGSRTLLLLRDGSEILKDLKENKNKNNNKKSAQNSNNNNNNNKERRDTDSIVSPEEIENNTSVFDIKPEDESNQTISSPSTSSPDEIPNNETLSPTTTIITTNTNDEGIDNSSVISGDGYQSDNWSVSSFRQQRYRSINDILNEYTGSNTRNVWTDGWTTNGNDNNNNNTNHNNNNNISHYNKNRSRPESKSSENRTFFKRNSINTITDIFDDSDDDYNQESMDEEEEEKEEFIRGMETFLRGVDQRRHQLQEATNANFGDASAHLGIEYRLIGCATFHKSYRSPGVKVVCIPFIAVRTRYRSCGIGRFLLKRLKRPSQVGPYDALVVQSDPHSQQFFRKNDFNDDIILCSRFKESITDDNGRELLPRSLSFGRRDLMCYLPPFDGHYPPMPGTNEWNRPEVTNAIDDEVERWRTRSLEAYQCQWTCIARLQQEITKLRSLLKRQEYGLNKLRKENMSLQKMLLKSETQSTLALIDAWHKETANYG